MFSRLFSCYNSNATLPPINTEPSKKIQWHDTLQFVPPINTGQVIKVYDGDTFTLAGHLPYEGSPLYRFSVRLNGIDCAEIKGKTEEEKQCAIRARTELEKLILDKDLIIETLKTQLIEMEANKLNIQDESKKEVKKPITPSIQGRARGLTNTTRGLKNTRR